MSTVKMIPGSKIPSTIEKDMQESYLRYSMSVIVSRALPDARDGFKPVHRRVLFGMHELGLTPAPKPTRKSATIVGEVMGKYHPHGDSAIYDTLVRMAQDFSLRYTLVDGQGNFGSMDGDPPAAMRYTEARMTHFAQFMLEDLDKDTVDFSPNFDDSLEEPVVLPSAFPNLLVNGSIGIAVGMATNMAPHNLREVADAIKAVIDNPEIPCEELLHFVKGPDFPTGAVICGRSGIRNAYLTGRGKIRVRADIEIETDSKDRVQLIVKSIPYMVNKKELLETIGKLVNDGKIEGINKANDESDREGMRIVIGLKKDAVPEVVKNNLFKYTRLQESFSIYNLALVNRQPKLLNLKDLCVNYVEHRHEVIRRRTEFELRKAKERAHILEGFLKAFVAPKDIDEVVRIIRFEDEPETVLQTRYALSELQIKAIMDVPLRNLKKINIEKYKTEYEEILLLIADLEDILAKKERIMAIVKTRLEEITEKYGDARRTKVEDAEEDFEDEDLIAEEEQVVTLSKRGYIRRLPIDTFKLQGRGGRGVIGTGLKDEDYVEKIFTASTHSYLLAFTNKGRMYGIKVYKLPEGARTGKGTPIVNFLGLAEGERVSAIVPVRKFAEGFYLVFCTKRGIINKMRLGLFSCIRRIGLYAMNLMEGDELVSVLLVQAENNLMIATKRGMAVTIPPDAFRSTGRRTRGVRGIRLEEGDSVIRMVDIKKESLVLAISEKGFAKRTDPEEYRITNRGGKGVVNMKVTNKTGEVVFVDSVLPDYDMIISTKEGKMIRIDLDSVRETGRSAQGVKAISLFDGDLVKDAAAIPSVEDIEAESDVEKTTFENADEAIESPDDVPLAGTISITDENTADEPLNDDDI
ncbi:MAG: DNA gyrase subunit A [Candidatus Fibromonas sp.]|jgi:DNA gyrase subunit A|nr:DNA gyrase subunit A [Candidatus Fibromonas sp.]